MPLNSMIAPLTGNPASRTETESEDVMVNDESLGTIISSFISPLVAHMFRKHTVRSRLGCSVIHPEFHVNP